MLNGYVGEKKIGFCYFLPVWILTICPMFQVAPNWRINHPLPLTCCQNKFSYLPPKGTPPAIHRTATKRVYEFHCSSLWSRAAKPSSSCPYASNYGEQYSTGALEDACVCLADLISCYSCITCSSYF
jgi:hypothetical protein